MKRRGDEGDQEGVEGTERLPKNAAALLQLEILVFSCQKKGRAGEFFVYSLLFYLLLIIQGCFFF